MKPALQKRIRKHIRTNTKIECTILRLMKKGKDDIAFLIDNVLAKHDLAHIRDEVFYTAMELGFNAIKANYRYILAMEDFRKVSKDRAHADVPLSELITDPHEFEEFSHSLDSERYTKLVNDIFRLENKAARIIAEADKECRTLTPFEKDRIRHYLAFSNKAVNNDIKVHFSITFDKETLIVEIVNDAPITFWGLKKIYSKRISFKEYFDKGQEEMFYIENLDSTESAGYGAAMIDARLNRFNIDPLTSFEIIKLGNKTVALVSFPVTQKNAEGA